MTISEDYHGNYGNGWIKLSRSIQGHWIWKDEKKLKAWLSILMKVNHTEKKVNIGNEIFTCHKGESLMSLESWAEYFGKGWNKSSVRRFFELLKKDGMIVQKSERKTTRLIVCNYDKYQDARNDDETIMKRKRNDDETQTTPTKERKERKERKEEYKEINKEKALFIFDNFRKKYPGTKRGNETEFNDFVKKHKDWNVILPVLETILDSQIKKRDVLNGRKEFVPAWKHLKTWIGNRCWEESINIVGVQENDNMNLDLIDLNNFKYEDE